MKNWNWHLSHSRKLPRLSLGMHLVRNLTTWSSSEGVYKGQTIIEWIYEGMVYSKFQQKIYADNFLFVFWEKQLMTSYIHSEIVWPLVFNKVCTQIHVSSTYIWQNKPRFLRDKNAKVFTTFDQGQLKLRLNEFNANIKFAIPKKLTIPDSNSTSVHSLYLPTDKAFFVFLCSIINCLNILSHNEIASFKYIKIWIGLEHWKWSKLKVSFNHVGWLASEIKTLTSEETTSAKQFFKWLVASVLGCFV